jgi:endogenous inhibitor of DNA gyrase (YacG/DUF329 family)
MVRRCIKCNKRVWRNLSVHGQFICDNCGLIDAKDTFFAGKRFLQNVGRRLAKKQKNKIRNKIAKKSRIKNR